MNEFKAGAPWTCRSCSHQFRLSRTYGNLLAWGAMALTAIFFYLLGLRGLRLVIAIIVMWFPCLLVCTFLVDRIMPPKLEPYLKESKDSPYSGLDLFKG